MLEIIIQALKMELDKDSMTPRIQFALGKNKLPDNWNEIKNKIKLDR